MSENPVTRFPMGEVPRSGKRVYEGKNNYDTPSPVCAGPISAELEVLYRTSTTAKNLGTRRQWLICH